MKLTILLLLLISFFCFACHKEQWELDFYDCDEYLGNHTLLPENRDFLPYQENTKVIFVDSFSNELPFIISNMYEEEIKAGYTHGTTSSPSIAYCYYTDYHLYTLRNDSLKFTLKVERMVDAEVEQSEVVILDQQSIRIDIDEGVIQDPFGYHVLVTALDLRTNLSRVYDNELLLVYTCFGRTFENVMRRDDRHDPIPVFHCNEMYGIVSFIDYTGKKWCFDRFE